MQTLLEVINKAVEGEVIEGVTIHCHRNPNVEDVYYAPGTVMGSSRETSKRAIPSEKLDVVLPGEELKEMFDFEIGFARIPSFRLWTPTWILEHRWVRPNEECNWHEGLANFCRIPRNPSADNPFPDRRHLATTSHDHHHQKT